MKSKIVYILLFFVFLTTSCSYQKSDNGKHCAKVEYYNPRTGTRSTYTLPVEVQNNKLVKIYWNNGGWLDDSHFTPPRIKKGKASFTTDKGYKYKVTILKKGKCNKIKK